MDPEHPVVRDRQIPGKLTRRSVSLSTIASSKLVRNEAPRIMNKVEKQSWEICGLSPDNHMYLPR